jgi:putative ABC transport system permease protein
MLQQLRVALRRLVRTPGYFALSCTTLALGIGAATVLFSVTESVLWRPLPFADSERLVFLAEQNIKRPSSGGGVSPGDFADWRSRARSFDGLAAFDWGEHHILSAPGFSRRVLSWGVSADFFETLRVRPVLGRTFQRSDERSANRVAIITDECWRRDFAGSPEALRKTIRIDGEPYAIAGVLPPGFQLDVVTTPDLFVPLSIGGPAAPRNVREWGAIGRLKSGVSIATAGDEMRSIARQLAGEYPLTDSGWTVTTENLRTSFTGFQSRTLFLFLGFSILVLAISCANVAGLLLVRFVAAQRDWALRLALGAGRVVLLREALAENLGIAVPGAAGGLLLAVWGVAAVRKWLPPEELLRQGQIRLDWVIALFVMAVMLGTTVVFTMMPASLAARLNIETALRDWGRTMAASRRIRRRIDLLMGAEVMLAFVLLFGAGLFASSYVRLTQAPLGFTPDGVLTMRVTPGAKQLSDAAARVRFYGELQRRVASVPGVGEVALAGSLPLTGTPGVSFVPKGGRTASEANRGSSLARVITPEYFRVLGVPVLRGRGFNAGDSASSPRVAIVNQRFARAVFGGDAAVGRQLMLLPEDDDSIAPGPVEIVGIAANATELAQDEVAFNDVYLPFAQNPARAMWIAGRTSVKMDDVAAAVRGQLRAMDPEGALDNLMTMDGRVRDSLRGSRFHLSLIAIFAGLAVLLACVGVYGAVGFSVSERTREFGLRMALGAQPAGIMKLAFAHTARLTVSGVACGLAIAIVAGWWLKEALYLVPHKHSGILFGVGIHDPASIAMAGVGVGLLAAARRRYRPGAHRSSIRLPRCIMNKRSKHPEDRLLRARLSLII